MEEEFVKLKEELLEAVEDSSTEQIISILQTLSDKKVTVEILKETQIGVAIGKLRKNDNKEISSLSKQIVDNWKVLVAPNNNTTSNNHTPKNTPSTTTSTEKHPDSSKKTETFVKTEKIESKLSKSNNSIKPESAPKEDKKRKVESDQEGPKKKAATSASGDQREIARDLLSRALGPPEEGELDADDVARGIEEELFNMYNLNVSKDYKAKLRSLTFNLKNEKNPKLRRNVLSGEIKPAELCSMTTQQLASPEQREKQKEIEAYHLQAVQLGQQEATTDMFQCGRCKNRKCTYYQLQTRSADEPMTTFVSCTVCKNRWKFC